LLDPKVASSRGKINDSFSNYKFFKTEAENNCYIAKIYKSTTTKSTIELG